MFYACLELPPSLLGHPAHDKTERCSELLNILLAILHMTRLEDAWSYLRTDLCEQQFVFIFLLLHLEPDDTGRSLAFGIPHSSVHMRLLDQECNDTPILGLTRPVKRRVQMNFVLDTSRVARRNKRL